MHEALPFPKTKLSDAVLAYRCIMYLANGNAICLWFTTSSCWPRNVDSKLVLLQVDVLLAASHPSQAEPPELSEEQQQVLNRLEERLNQAIQLYEEDGAFIKLNDRSESKYPKWKG